MKKLFLAAVILAGMPFLANAQFVTDTPCGPGHPACPSGYFCDSLSQVCLMGDASVTATSGFSQIQNTGSGFTALAPIPGLTDANSAVANSASLAVFFNNLYKYLIGLAAALAVIEIIWGGIEISTKDSVPLKMKGKERIYGAVFGLVLVLSPVVVFSIINPSILNLSVNLPPLNTQSGISAASSTCSNNACATATPTTLVTGGKLYPCTDKTSCSAAENTCSSAAPTGWLPVSGVVCVKPDGTIDPNGRTDSLWNPFSAYSCVSGESLSVSCVYSQSTVTAP